MKVLRRALWRPLVATKRMPSETLPGLPEMHYREKKNYKIQSSPWNFKHIGCDGQMTHIHIFPTLGQIILKASILLRKLNSA